MRLPVHSIRPITIAAVAFAATACAGTGISDPGPGKRVIATVDRSDYLAGQKISVTATNVSIVSLEYPIGFCKIVLEREDAAGWTPVVVPEGCPLAIAFLGPRQAVTLQYVLPTGLTTGTYRLSMPMPVPKWGTSPPEPALLTPTFKIDSGAL